VQPSDAARGNHENSGGDSRRGANLASKPNPAGPAGKSGHADYAETTSSTDSAPATQVRAPETPVTAVPHQATQTAPPEASTASKAADTRPAPVESAGDVEAKPAAPQAQQISLRIPGNNNQNVEIRVMDRAGEVRVSVHTPDETLAHSMREELGSLTGKLSQGGFGTEAWTPSRPDSSTFSNQRGTSDQQESTGGQRQGSQQGSSDQQSKRDDGRRPAWLEELENSQAQDQSNRSNIWPLQ
jgi:hypothetical protein